MFLIVVGKNTRRRLCSGREPVPNVIASSLSERATSRIRKVTLLLSSVAVLLAGGGAARGQSALDGFDPNVNGTVHVVVVQPDGKILIGGSFTAVRGVPRGRIARLNPNGTLDMAFNPRANNTVHAIAVQADGKILVGGSFSGVNSIGGASRNRIARLDAVTGSADSFNPRANNTVLAIAVHPNGNILVGGSFSGTNSIGGAPRNRIARLDAATGSADSFNPRANNRVHAIAVQGDGRILVGGSFSGASSIGGASRNRIARLNPTTGLADSFNPRANNTVHAIAVQADGKILVGGSFSGANSIGGAARYRIARLDVTTGLADSFNPRANNTVLAIAVQADGKILVGGVFAGANSIGEAARNRIARLDAMTGLADSFNPRANNIILAIAVQGDGKILVGGFFTAFAPNGEPAVTRNRVARLETDGRVDRTLAVHIDGYHISALAVQRDGKILIGGNFNHVLGVQCFNIARLNTDGTLDTAFNPHANGAVTAIAVEANGKILVGGLFTAFGLPGSEMVPRNHIARLDATTGLPDSFDPNALYGVMAIAVQPDGKILAGGFFNGDVSIGGQSRSCIARLDPTTGLADAFNPNANGFVYSITVQGDGKILVGGSFGSIGGQTRNHIARLDAATGLADSFNPSPNGNSVFAIAVQTDGKILVSGDFSGENSIGGQLRNRIARLDPSGSADSFDPDANADVYSITAQSDGKVVAGGAFTSIGGQTRKYLARLDSTGSADSFDPNADNGVFATAVQEDGKILAVGQFTSIGGQSRSLLARFSNDTAALQNIAVTQSSITWARSGSNPQFARVTFEYSTDNVSYAPLGSGTAADSNWSLTGLNLPTVQNFYIRARGYYRSGQWAGSESSAESVRNVFLPPGS